MKYVTVEVAVDETDDARAENVVIAALDHAKEGRRGELLRNFQVVGIEDEWSEEAKLYGAHRG